MIYNNKYTLSFIFPSVDWFKKKKKIFTTHSYTIKSLKKIFFY